VIPFVLGLWGVVTALFAILSIYKQKITQTDESLILSPALANQAKDQQLSIARVERVAVWVKCLGFTSLGLLVLAGLISVVSAMKG
jgi:hypothetical protein